MNLGILLGGHSSAKTFAKIIAPLELDGINDGTMESALAERQ